jgi:DNA-binding LytR/AlgR family response regulator
MLEEIIMRSIYNVAIVEDEVTHLNALKDMLERYKRENGVNFSVTSYRDIETFLFEYKNCFDIVFMDIELPGMNGMDGARRLRAIDPVAVLIFVTNMAQFAVQGYEVDALDYMLKPVIYKNFAIKCNRALKVINLRPDKYVVVHGENNINRMSVNDIIYVEVRGHHMNFHLSNSNIVDVCGALGKLAEELKDYGFARCNSCYLLNMKFIKEITSNFVVMSSGDELLISKRRKKDFLNEFAAYVGMVHCGESD